MWDGEARNPDFLRSSSWESLDRDDGREETQEMQVYPTWFLKTHWHHRRWSILTLALINQWMSNNKGKGQE